MTQRVQTYECSTHYKHSGSTHHDRYPFLPEHFQEAGVPMHPDGMPYEAAEALCEKWSNPRRQNKSITSRCSLSVVDRLMALDNRRAAEKAAGQALAEAAAL